MDFPHLSKVFLDNNFNFLVLKLGWGFLVPICIIFLLVFAQTNKFVWSYSILEIYFFFCIFETQLIWGKTLIMVALMIHLRSPEERQNPEGLRSSDHHRGNPRPPPDAIRWSEHQDTRVSLVGCIIFPFFFFFGKLNCMRDPVSSSTHQPFLWSSVADHLPRRWSIPRILLNAIPIPRMWHKLYSIQV